LPTSAGLKLPSEQADRGRRPRRHAPVIQANNGDTAHCSLTADGEQTRVLTIKILDDATGDFTVTGARIKR
jgi:hypothetical protein